MAGFWSILVPEATENLITNPSIELDTTGFTAVGGSIDKFESDQLFGLSCLRIQPTTGVNDGAYYGTVSLENGSSYTFSLYIKGTEDKPYKIYFANTSGTLQGSSTDFVASGDWEKQSVTWACDSTNDFRLYVVKDDDANTDSFFVDGLQLEKKAYETTYCDGDQPGCEWAAATQASISTRDSQARSGGRLFNLDDYSFYIREFSGIGMPSITHQTLSRPLLPGALYKGSKIQPRVFDLVGENIGNSWEDLHLARKNLLNAIKPDLVVENQPIVLRYTGANTKKSVEISCQYDTGFEFGKTSGFAETNVLLRLIAYDDPFFREVGNTAHALTTSKSISSVNYLLAKIDGVWDKLGTGGNTGTIYAIARGIDGSIYAAGSFTQMGGVSNTGYIARWDGSSWNAMGTGSNGVVRALLVAPNGDLYAGGDFTQMGGVSNTAYIARWNGSSWNALGSGMNDNVHCLCLGLDGVVYAGGEFTTAGGSGINYIAQWDGSTWADLDTDSVNNTVRCMATAQNGYIWFGGDFTDVGPTAERVAYYDPVNDSVGIPNDGVASGSVYALVIDDQGRIWIGGSFTSVGGITANRIALYDGQGWLKLGDGLDSTCYALQFQNGIIYAGGAFTTAGDLSLLDGLAIWNGYTWAYLDCDLPGTATVNALLILNDDYYLGFNQAGTATTAQDQTLVNDGTREAFPKIVIERSGGTALGLKYIKNETTGAILYLNYDLLDGERLTIDTTEGSRSVKSSYFGSVWRALLRSSDFSIFSLFPGSNVISVLITESGTPTITAYMQWVIKHWSSDGVAN